jgi:hypothetical protein
MNKLTKVGCSALCGSLAAISAANAGDLTVTGGADMTWVSLNKDTTGNPIGIGTNFNMKGSGELDNGWTYDLTIAHTNVGAYSAANVTIDMGGLGKLNFNQGNSGNGISAFDDKMPTAWEESWGAGLSTGVRLALGSGASQNVMYTTPTVAGTTLTFTFAPEYGAADVNDKATADAGTANKRSYDATININPSLGTEILSGLNIFGGATTIESVEKNYNDITDRYEGVAGITYDIGPLSLGAQWSGDYTGVDDDPGSGENSTGYNFYKAHAFGVAFNVNDDLSISYGEWLHRKAGYASTATNQVAENGKVIEISSLQIAYTMGGASFRIADLSVDNAAWSAGDNKEATVISLGLAF